MERRLWSGPICSEAAMRVRLRAPDEDVGGNGSGSGSETSATTGGSGGHANSLPHFDVRSPEYIEERLENLKRRPSWRSWLDQYVEDHPEDSDDETEEDAEDIGGEVRKHALLCCLCSMLYVVRLSLMLYRLHCWPLNDLSIRKPRKPKGPDSRDLSSGPSWFCCLHHCSCFCIRVCARRARGWPL